MSDANRPSWQATGRASGDPESDAVAQQMEWAASVQSGAARAAVLGINDGLVTNISLIVGMVGCGGQSGSRAAGGAREPGGGRLFDGAVSTSRCAPRSSCSNGCWPSSGKR